MGPLSRRSGCCGQAPHYPFLDIQPGPRSSERTEGKILNPTLRIETIRMARIGDDWIWQADVAWHAAFRLLYLRRQGLVLHVHGIRDETPLLPIIVGDDAEPVAGHCLHRKRDQLIVV